MAAGRWRSRPRPPSNKILAGSFVLQDILARGIDQGPIGFRGGIDQDAVLVVTLQILAHVAGLEGTVGMHQGDGGQAAVVTRARPWGSRESIGPGDGLLDTQGGATSLVMTELIRLPLVKLSS